MCLLEWVVRVEASMGGGGVTVKAVFGSCEMPR